MSLIVPEEIERYAEQHTTPHSELLQRLAEETKATLDRPQMLTGTIEGRFLEFIVYMTGARRILELGTYSGYSAISMAAALPAGGQHRHLRGGGGACSGRAALHRGGGLHGSHHDPPGSRPRDDRPPGRRLRLRLHRRGQGELRQLLRGGASQAFWARPHRRRQHAVEWPRRGRVRAGRGHESDPSVQRPRSRRRPGGRRDAFRAGRCHPHSPLL